MLLAQEPCGFCLRRHARRRRRSRRVGPYSAAAGPGGRRRGGSSAPERGEERFERILTQLGVPRDRRGMLLEHVTMRSAATDGDDDAAAAAPRYDPGLGRRPQPWRRTARRTSASGAAVAGGAPTGFEQRASRRKRTIVGVEARRVERVTAPPRAAPAPRRREAVRRRVEDFERKGGVAAAREGDGAPAATCEGVDRATREAARGAARRLRAAWRADHQEWRSRQGPGRSLRPRQELAAACREKCVWISEAESLLGDYGWSLRWVWWIRAYGSTRAAKVDTGRLAREGRLRFDPSGEDVSAGDARFEPLHEPRTCARSAIRRTARAQREKGIDELTYRDDRGLVAFYRVLGIGAAKLRRANRRCYTRSRRARTRRAPVARRRDSNRLRAAAANVGEDGGRCASHAPAAVGTATHALKLLARYHFPPSGDAQLPLDRIVLPDRAGRFLRATGMFLDTSNGEAIQHLDPSAAAIVHPALGDG